MTAQKGFHDWHQSRIEALLLDVAERLSLESETTVTFHYPRPEGFRQSVLQQLEWSGFTGRFQQDLDSGLLQLLVRRRL